MQYPVPSDIALPMGPCWSSGCHQVMLNAPMTPWSITVSSQWTWPTVSPITLRHKRVRGGNCRQKCRPGGNCPGDPWLPSQPKACYYIMSAFFILFLSCFYLVSILFLFQKYVLLAWRPLSLSLSLSSFPPYDFGFRHRHFHTFPCCEATTCCDYTLLGKKSVFHHWILWHKPALASTMWVSGLPARISRIFCGVATSFDRRVQHSERLVSLARCCRRRGLQTSIEITKCIKMPHLRRIQTLHPPWPSSSFLAAAAYVLHTSNW